MPRPVPRNVGRPCDDATDDDLHSAEGGRTRCYFHHREHRKWQTARYRAKAAGEDTSNWDWEADRPRRPAELRTSRPQAIPENLKAQLMKLLDEMETTGGPVMGAPGTPKTLTQQQGEQLGETLNELIYALERLLYGRPE